jgi:hypothetical protein
MDGPVAPLSGRPVFYFSTLEAVSEVRVYMRSAVVSVSNFSEKNMR